jgi:hypothetical protein
MASVELNFFCTHLLVYFQVPRVCPGCRTAWRMLSADGDAANTSYLDNPREVDDEDEDTRVRVPASTATRRTTRAGQASQASHRRLKAKLEESSDDENGNDDDDDESDGAQPAPSQAPMSQRRVIQSRKKMKARR